MTEKSIIKSMNNRIVLASPFKRHDRMVSNLCWRLGTDVVRIEKCIDLLLEQLDELRPDYIFFPHWSWKIPDEIHHNYECVIFHMTDLPFGRGGSPLQNLIVRGIEETKLTALRCTETLDAGPIYLKSELSLLGSAEEIFIRANSLIEEMIVKIVSERITPIAQMGEPTIFIRRNRNDGDISNLESLKSVHDFIRMLDAEGYPPAFVETKNLCFEFRRASLKPDEIHADVTIKLKKIIAQ